MKELKISERQLIKIARIVLVVLFVPVIAILVYRYAEFKTVMGGGYDNVLVQNEEKNNYKQDTALEKVFIPIFESVQNQLIAHGYQVDPVFITNKGSNEYVGITFKKPDDYAYVKLHVTNASYKEYLDGIYESSFSGRDLEIDKKEIQDKLFIIKYVSDIGPTERNLVYFMDEVLLIIETFEDLHNLDEVVEVLSEIIPELKLMKGVS